MITVTEITSNNSGKPIPGAGMIIPAPNEMYQLKSGRAGYMNNEAKFMHLLAMRMRWEEGLRIPFEHLSLHATDQQAFVFVVHKGEATILDDDPGLFPSDELITKLRLILG